MLTLEQMFGRLCDFLCLVKQHNEAPLMHQLKGAFQVIFHLFYLRDNISTGDRIQGALGEVGNSLSRGRFTDACLFMKQDNESLPLRELVSHNPWWIAGKIPFPLKRSMAMTMYLSSDSDFGSRLGFWTNARTAPACPPGLAIEFHYQQLEISEYETTVGSYH